jgi:hypothetical protein
MSGIGAKGSLTYGGRSPFEKERHLNYVSKNQRGIEYKQVIKGYIRN